MAGTDSVLFMLQHQQVVEHFIEGRGGRGTYMMADERDGAVFSAYRPRWRSSNPNAKIPLAIHLEDGGILTNGARLNWPSSRHQTLVLQTLEQSQKPFGVVPFDSITAAWTDGKIRDWKQAPFTLRDLRKEVSIVVPSVGERWYEVTTKDNYGKLHTRNVHTLGD